MRKPSFIAQFVVLLLVALGAGPIGASVWQWNTAAAPNATADPSINWAEGMSPSAVNNSARAMMAGVAQWRDDISGVNSTTGDGVSYQLTTKGGLNTTPAGGTTIGFFSNLTNGANPTLQVDGGNTYPIRLGGGTAAPEGTIIAGSPYKVTFTGSSWSLEGAYGNPYSVPLGGLMYSTAPSPPNSNFIVPAGQCISTSTYAAYWNLIGTPGQGSCPVGTFQIIDLRGRYAAMLDQPAGFAAALRLTTVGCGTAFNSVGVVCGTGTETKQLTPDKLPVVTGVTSGSLSVATTADNFVASNPNDSTPVSAQAGGAAGAVAASHVEVNHLISHGTATGSLGFTSTNTQAGGVGGSFSVIGPTVGVNVFLRVL